VSWSEICYVHLPLWAPAVKEGKACCLVGCGYPDVWWLQTFKELTASIISISPLRRKQKDLPKCCPVSTRPHVVTFQIFANTNVKISNLSQSTVCIHPLSLHYRTLYVSTLNRVSNEPENSLTCGVKVFVSSTGMLCDREEIKHSVTFKLGIVTTEQQIISART
jgi:hypothetical protein